MKTLITMISLLSAAVSFSQVKVITNEHTPRSEYYSIPQETESVTITIIDNSYSKALTISYPIVAVDGCEDCEEVSNEPMYEFDFVTSNTMADSFGTITEMINDKGDKLWLLDAREFADGRISILLNDEYIFTFDGEAVYLEEYK